MTEMTIKLTPALTTLALAVALWSPCPIGALEPPTPTSTDAEAPSPTAEKPGPASEAATAKPAKHVYKEQAGDLPNFHSVHPFLYRGGEPTADGVKKIKALGVGTIIDLRAPSQPVSDQARIARALGMTTINLPMSSKAPTDEQVKTFLDAVQKAKDDPASGKAFVHCAHGSDRTGCLVGVWRVVKDGWSYDDTYKEMRKYYFGPKFTNLSGTVERYAKKAKPLATK